ncbi:hypothetical protein [Mycobacterium sp. OTB74]|jgi:hypothetical protein|uniref:hypothetical protein n=1 Tax=Mycobacterium sp. OTB74 TaxID=1853452 RepID=UPI0024752DA0|nr:hypothetical protein [Mycobacterium sp. OTB74]MDH6248000.1 hypothetical protein [Mycobacterium sp. OTB74]
MTTTPETTAFKNWTTIGVVPLLAEWTNVFYYPNATTETDRWLCERCPALLLQECTSIEVWPDNAVRSVPRETPRETRVVYAATEHGIPGTLCEADLEEDHYIGTFPGGEPDAATKATLAQEFTEHAERVRRVAELLSERKRENTT